MTFFKKKSISINYQKKIIYNFPITLIKQKFYLESYGCQMNFSDSEIITSILIKNGFYFTPYFNQADLILLNTCSIRERTERIIYNRLNCFNYIKKKNPNIIIGVLGCMAQHFKYKWIKKDKIIDLVVGPDSYRKLPILIKKIKKNKIIINVSFSKKETYSDIYPVRLGKNFITAFVTIMRGCDNMCTFCIVPFTRGRERSRDPYSIIYECKELWEKGYKEVILLGQNVDSYLWYGGGIKKDFSKASLIHQTNTFNFSDLLNLVASTLPMMRIRFSTSNPYDISEKVIQTISKYSNICKHIHLPVQSGSTKILKKMNRRYTREQYINLIDKIRKIIPNCAISCDIIVGFCGETKNDHLQTLSLMEYVHYNFCYMFSYSVRHGTLAEKKLIDNVPDNEKKIRLQEVISLQQKHSYECMKKCIGTTQEVLIEGLSKKNSEYFRGRNSQNSVIVFPKESYKLGDLVNVYIDNCTSATLFGKIISI